MTEPIRRAPQYDIKQLPSIKLFREGEFVKNYAGQATEMAFLNFARKELNPGPRLLVTMEEFQSFTDNDDVQVNSTTSCLKLNKRAEVEINLKVVGFFGLFPTDLKNGYRLAVDRLGQSVQFGLVDDPDLMRNFKQFEDRVVLFRPKASNQPVAMAALLNQPLLRIALVGVDLRPVPVQPARGPGPGVRRAERAGQHHRLGHAGVPRPAGPPLPAQPAPVPRTRRPHLLQP